MKAYDYCVVNEYGSVLLETAEDTILKCQDRFRELFEGRPLKDLGCCIVQLVPTPLIEKPSGYWFDPTRAIKPEVVP